MSKVANVVYNPTDPIAYQMSKTSGILGEDEISVDSLVDNPVAIRLLVRQQMQMLVELKGQKDEIVELKGGLKQFGIDRELLLIEATKLREREKEREGVSLVEIPVSLLGGFAINMLTGDIQSHMGWILLIISLACILLLRGKQISQTFQRVTQKGGDDGTEIDSRPNYPHS